MTTSNGCGCVNTLPTTIMQGGGSYINELVNLAIPIGFLLAKNTFNKASKDTQKTGHVGGNNSSNELMTSLQNLGGKIQAILDSR